MISRRKLIAALGASLLPSVAHAATSTAPPPPEKSKPVAKAPAKPAAKVTDRPLVSMRIACPGVELIREE